jgi:glycosyltransferase involved in cell wall biosynthesis
MRDVREATTFGDVLVVDHTTQTGGAELALPRLARHADSSWRFLFLEPMAEGLEFDQGADVRAPRERLGPFGQMVYLRKQLRAHQERVVVSNTLRAAFLVTLVKPRRQPHVQILRDGVSPDSLSPVRRLVTSFVFSFGVTRILPNSAWTGSTVPRRYRRLVGSPVYSPSGTSPDTSRRPSDDARRPLKLLSLSRVVEWKGIHVILEALEEMKQEFGAAEVELTIAGDTVMGPQEYSDALRASASRLPFPVHFLPHQQDVGPLLDSHDVLVHASTRPEPFGQVVVQGLAHGLVVLASRGGGPGELVSDGETGLLHDPGNAASLADSIRKLLHDRDAREALATAGMERARAFSDSRCAALLEEQIAPVISDFRAMYPPWAT